MCQHACGSMCISHAKVRSHRPVLSSVAFLRQGFSLNVESMGSIQLASLSLPPSHRVGDQIYPVVPTF